MKEKIENLSTPGLILDVHRLDRNLARMRAGLERLKTPLRPHAKTAKSIEVVRRALEGQPGGITVSTMAEAAWFFEHGIVDIVYAVGLSPQRLGDAAALISRGCQLKLLTDSPELARVAAEAGRILKVSFPVLLELDCDGHRAGLEPAAQGLVECARILHENRGVEFAGVLTHAGGSYDARSIEEITRAASRERAAAADSAGILQESGIPCPIVSIGSTPTARFAQDLTGVTEVRAGVYMFNDLVMVSLGVCTLEDLALSVITTVIGHQPLKGWALVDAGWMALSRDRGTEEMGLGYGMVCNAVDCRPMGDLVVIGTNQEHGIVASRSGDCAAVRSIPIGSRLRILPIHACATAAMHDFYHVADEQGEITARWSRMRGW